MKILMVCLGNICRSPLAEGIMAHKIKAYGLNWKVDSAGTNGYHVGESPHPLSQKVAKLHGIDISRQRARSFAAADFDQFDRIYVMAEDVWEDVRRLGRQNYRNEKVVLLMNEAFPGSDMEVPDPWYGTEKGYHEVYALLDQACDAIIRNYSMELIVKNEG